MAKLFLDATDTSYKVSNGNTEVFGANGDQAITIDGNLTGVVLDANVERVAFTGSTTDYTYKQVGTDLEVYKGTTLVTKVGLQDDTTGTQLTFANGTVDAKFAPSATGLGLTVGGQTVSATAPTAVTIPAANIDVTTFPITSPTFSVASVAATATEGSNAVFTVTLANPATTATTVEYTLTNLTGATNADTSDETISGTGVTGVISTSTNVDGPYTGSLTFAAGATTATVTLPVSLDSLTETTEGVSLTLSNPTGGAIVNDAGKVATVSFVDAPATTFTLTSTGTGIEVQEGQTITFTVTPNAAVNAATTLVLNVKGQALGGVTNTTTAADFETAANVTFAQGETAAKTITLKVAADTATEGREAYAVDVLDTTAYASRSNTVAGVVTDALPNLTLTASATSVNEGAAVTYTVTSSVAAPVGGLTIPFTLGGTATSADYTTSATGNIVIAAGATTGTLVINATADNLTDTAGETVSVQLGTVSGANVVTTTPVVTTINDTSVALAANAFSLSGAASADEGTTATYTVTRGSAATVATTVPYTITGTAVSGTDFTGAASGTLSFAVGATTATISLPITADLLTEGAETIIVTLGTPSNATDIITTGAGTVTTTVADTSVAAAVVPFTLTTAADTVPTTANSITGFIDQNTTTNSTLQVFDTIAPTSAATLNATVITKNSGAVAGINTTGVTTINATPTDILDGADSYTWSMAGHTGVTTFNVKNASVLGTTADTLTISSFAKATTLGVIGGSKYQNITTSITSGDDSGSADQLNMALSATAKAKTITLAGSYEKLAIANAVDATIADIDSLALSGTKLQSLTVTGSGGIKATVAASSFDSSTSVVKLVDASGATGKIDLSLGDTLTNQFTSVKGGSGSTDKITFTGGTSPTTTSAVNISGFETIVSKTTTGATYDATNFGTAALGAAIVGSTANAVTYSNIADGSTLLLEGQKTSTDTAASAAGTSIGATTVNLSATVRNATSAALANALTVKINNQGTDLSTVTGSTTVASITAGTITTPNVKAITVNAADANVVITNLVADQLLNLTLTGTKALTVGGSTSGTDTVGVASKTLTVDASGVVGKTTMQLTNALEKDFTYTGSNAVDALTIGALTQTTTAAGNTVTINTGTGNDTVTLNGAVGTGTVGTGAVTSSTLKLNLGDGDDTLTIANSADIIAYVAAPKSHAIDFGAGTDSLLFAGSTATDISASTIAGLEKIILTGTGNLSVRASSVLGATSTTGTELSIFSTGTVDLKAAPGSTGETIDGTKAFLTTAKALSITGNDGNDTLTANAAGGTITGGLGTDTIALGTGTDTVVFNAAVIAATARDTITSFTTTTDKIQLSAANTTVATAAGSAAVVDTSTTAASTGGGAYALTTASSTTKDVILLSVTAAGVNSGTLSAATDGTELLKALTDASAADTYTVITASTASDKCYFAATQGGTGYLYYANSAADGTAASFSAADIVLIGTFTSGTIATTDFAVMAA